jgi:hypothetical protein
VLYEICCRYADNPGGLTARQPWPWWRPVLTGAPDSPTSAYQEYKIFNRDVLKKAVKKVNDVSDLEIELVEHRTGRSVQDLQFRVKRKTAVPPIAERPIEPVDLKTIGAAIKAGIPQERAEKHLLKYGAKALEAALEIMQQRTTRSNMDPVRSPDKYLTTLLQSGQFGEQPPKPSAAPTKSFDTKAERLKLIERYMAKKRAELHEMFMEMPKDDQQQWIARFETEGLPSSDVVRKAYAAKGIASQIVRPAFLKFLGNAIWEDGWEKPSESDLLDIAIAMRQEDANAIGPTRTTRG